MRFRAASDRALLVYLGEGEKISLATHHRVVALLRLIQRERPGWLRNLQPAYSSLLVEFDALQLDHDAVQSAVQEYAQRAEHLPSAPSRKVEIPVCYGGEFGPDLDEVASRCKLTPQAVVELHTSIPYHTYFLGFAPGFAYLGDLPDEVACPRLASPRKLVPAGSVGIAGKQTGVYPFATPGGWRLIGRTPMQMFRTDREPMGVVEIGDEVRFRAITREEFSSLAAQTR